MKTNHNETLAVIAALVFVAILLVLCTGCGLFSGTVSLTPVMVPM